jgi:hypothetical protein
MRKRRLTKGEKKQAKDDYITGEQAREPGVILMNVTVEGETDEDGKPIVKAVRRAKASPPPPRRKA